MLLGLLLLVLLAAGDANVGISLSRDLQVFRGLQEVHTGKFGIRFSKKVKDITTNVSLSIS